MERILHRANTAERIRAGIEASCDRLEVDLWYRSGTFRISHDRTFGPIVLGRSGVTISQRRYLPIRVARTYLTLPALLRRRLPPLLIDLWGRWSDRALVELAILLASYRRDEDALTTKQWETLDRYRRIDPDRPCFYSADTAAMLFALFDRLAFDRHIRAVSLHASLFREQTLLAADLKDRDITIYVWGIPDRRTLARLAADGIDGAILDDPMRQ